MAVQQAAYPVVYTVDSPAQLSRWMWLIKWLLLLPHAFLLMFVGFAALFVMTLSWFAILITGKHPRGLWNFLLGVNRWSVRVNAYMYHLTDRYPPFAMSEEPGYPVRIDAAYPASSNRLTTFFRFFLVIPHWIILSLLSYLLWILWFIHVVIVLITGKPNGDLVNFIIGAMRWQTRATMYWQLMTDEYPPFSFE